MISDRHLWLLAVPGLIIGLGLLVGCNQTPTPTPAPTATVPPTTEPSPTPSPTSEPGPLPKVLTQVPLAPPGETLEDLILDRAANRLYVTDTAGQLHVLDAATYTELTTLPVTGKLTLDAANHRLYASPENDTGQVTVVDADSLAVVGTVAPSGYVAVDGARQRFYVGNRIHSSTPEDAPGVRVYDRVTLKKLGEVPQPGIPVYNPLRDELYIVAYTMYAVNLDTLDTTADLFPDITAQSPAWCNGCSWVADAHVFPERNWLLVELESLSKTGTERRPRFLDATTLSELTTWARLSSVEYGCQGRLLLVEPVDDHVYQERFDGRYVRYANLVVHDRDGKLLTWRDGLYVGITNPNTRQMYIQYRLGVLVLDLTTLSPLGTLPYFCFYTMDAAAGRIYASRDNDLIVLSQSGGEPELLPPLPVAALPATNIRSIRPSPDYRHDQTLWLDQGSQFYRSRDGGQTWARLRGGLPAADHQWARGLSISPDFARDHTLFAYGYVPEFWGEGVYRSTDSGDTWQPTCDGLTHWRVHDVALSPDYATDGTLLACAEYLRIGQAYPYDGGYSVFRSTDRGLHWTLAMTQTLSAGPPSSASLLPAMAEPTTRFRKAFVEGKSAVERTTDGGQTWETVLVLPSEPYTTIEAVLPSPDFATDQTVYALHDYGLLRTTDGGETWQKWTDDRLVGRDYKNGLTALAVSPSLGEGKHQLFIGTAAGEFWVLDPAAMTWEPLRD